MCGIAGTLDFQGRAIAQADLLRACDAMGHRGPDDRGVWIDAGEPFSIGMAAVRLAVIDLSSAARQPMHIAGGRYTVAYNGELYNFRELRDELRALGVCFHTASDTEVVAAACGQWGADALPRFNGMFALAFFDRVARCGFLARDRFGIKPLLVAASDGRVHFASEMNTLRCFADWDRAIDSDALLYYLHFGYFAAPQSIHAHVRRLGSGAYQPFDADGLHPPVSYVPACAEAPPMENHQEACAAVRAAMYRSVARRRVADVPVGAFLSGGIDSSIVATHLAECTPGSIRTFAIGFREHARYDETRYARLMAERLGSRHVELKLSFDDVIDEIEPMFAQLGEPFFDSSMIPMALVSRLARAQVTVCLSGDGGDELFGGYWRYLGHDAVASFGQLPKGLRRAVRAVIDRHTGVSKTTALQNRMRQVRKLLRAGDDPPALRHLRWSALIDEQSRGILRDPGASKRVFADMVHRFEQTAGDASGGDALNRILAFDLRCGLPGDMLHKVDIASMRHSLEVRVPFLDPEVVAAAEACPSSFKVDRGMRKRLLVDAYRDRIPDVILDREKMGFELPVGEFLRTRLRDLFLSTVTQARVESFGVLDHAAVMRLYDDHCARRGEYADLLFALLSLCWWRSRSSA